MSVSQEDGFAGQADPVCLGQPGAAGDVAVPLHRSDRGYLVEFIQCARNGYISGVKNQIGADGAQGGQQAGMQVGASAGGVCVGYQSNHQLLGVTQVDGLCIDQIAHV